jgi:vancomycin permeability regulator SanA
MILILIKHIVIIYHMTKVMWCLSSGDNEYKKFVENSKDSLKYLIIL